MPVSAPADKRFRRAHVKPARKRRVGLRQVWIVGRAIAVFGLMAYGGWRGVALVLGAPALAVARIAVHGNERLSTGEVLGLVEGLRSRNILTISLDSWRTRLLSSPWVEDAKLRRVLPATIEIVIRERNPIGIGRVAGGLYLVDGSGVIVDEFGPNYADLDLPVIAGLATVPSDGAPVVDARRASLAARFIQALQARPDLAGRVSEIDVSDVHDAVVILEGETVMLRLGEQEFVERLQEYLDLREALHERISAIDYVDLRFDERLYVRPVAVKK
jgi:cell division protein FtsQ